VTRNSDQPIQIYDPVNPENSVAKDYTNSDRDIIVEYAENAIEAISEARYATTKERAESCWKRIFGNSFRVES